MRTISKSANPPACLEKVKPQEAWEDFMKSPCHPAVGDSLHAEQRGLCCYCEGNIERLEGHIEHMNPRAKAPALAYDYANLAFSCNGGAHGQHCGHRKAGHYDSARFIAPHDPRAESGFRYLQEGSVLPSGNGDRASAAYMIKLLALDCPRLTGRRREHARRLIETLGAAPDPTILQWLREYYLGPGSDGLLREYHSLSRELLSPKP